MKRIPRIAAVLLFLLLVATPSRLDAQELQYYSFQYYYTYSFVESVHGEVRVLRDDGSQVSLSMLYHEWRETLCCDNATNLADSSLSESFVAAEGDIISWFSETSVHYNTPERYVDIGDTLRVIVQLVDADNRDLLLVLDTSGVRPAASFTQLASAFIRQDSNYIRSAPIPDSLAGRHVQLRFQPEFSGHDTLDRYCRVDLSSYVPRSLSVAEMYLAIDEFFLSLPTDSLALDSLLQTLMKGVAANRDGGEEHGVGTFILHVSPNPTKRHFSLHIDSREIGRGQPVTVFMFDTGGKEVRRIQSGNGERVQIDVTMLSSGAYYLLPVVGERVYKSTVVHVL